MTRTMRPRRYRATRRARSRIIRLLAGLLTVAASAHLVDAIVRRRRAIQQIPVGLRTPALWMPFSLGHPLGLIRLLRGRSGPPPPTTQHTERWLGTGATALRLHLYRHPATSAIPAEGSADDQGSPPTGAVIWLHGGGTVIGSAAQDHQLCAALARDLGVLVVNVDYRLAPEHRFPAALDDAHQVLVWLSAHAATLGVDPSRIAVAGSSAGGGLAAALAQRATDHGPRLCHQALISPMLDDRPAARRPERRSVQFVWTSRSNRFGWRSYLGHPPGGVEHRPYAVPARRQDLTGLPPAWIGVGTADLLHDEAIAYATALQAAEVPCRLLVVPGMYHTAETEAPDAPAMVAFHDSFRQSLAAALAPDRAGTP